MTHYRVAADIGGTFTDLALISSDDELFTAKVPSTPADYAEGILNGIRALLGSVDGLDAGKICEVLHASTIATNAILEAKGARTALVTTRGFRDVLELRRVRVPRLYEPLYQKPAPLAARRNRFEVTERVAADGQVITPLDEAEVESVAATLAESGIEAVAVCFINSFTNPSHERRAGEILRDRLGDRFVTLSVDILPEIREYERTSTTVINAYVGPPVERYLSSLTRRLKAAGIRAPLRMMQSSGGVLDVTAVMERPATVVESGPAAGVIGAARLGAERGLGNLITFDMGGTTAKASVVEDGKVVSTDEYEVGGGISLSSRLVKGGGYALKLPVIDVSEVGAGGGSVIWRDPTGALKVGPHSAGAVPGPACYGRGGTLPTVTDATVVLGYLSPTAITGGTVPIDRAAALRALETVSDGRDLHEIAHGVLQLTVAAMTRAVKAVTTYRGRDPRDFSMMAFGGGGGVLAADLVRALGIRQILVPPAAGVFSAVGLLLADIGTSVSRGHLRDLDALAPVDIARIYEELGQELARQLDSRAADLSVVRRVDFRYAGQAFEISIALPPGPITREGLTGAAECFEEEHERTYGHRLPPRHIKQAVTLRLSGVRRRDRETRLEALCFPSASGERGRAAREVYFGSAGINMTPVIARDGIGSEFRNGPLIVEEYDGTIVVPPDARVRHDEAGNVIISFEETIRA